MRNQNTSNFNTTNISIAQLRDFVKSRIVENYNNDYKKAKNNEGRTLFQSAYTGSPVKYDVPSLDYIGTGEGAQAHGWGLYYAKNKDVAEGYRKRLTSIDEIILYKGESPKYIEFKNGMNNIQLLEAIIYRGKKGVLKQLEDKQFLSLTMGG